MDIDPNSLTYADSVPQDIRKRLRSAVQIVSRSTVRAEIDRIAVRVTAEFQEQNPVCVGLLPGGALLTGMLLQRVVVPMQVLYKPADANLLPMPLNGCPLLFVHGLFDAEFARDLEDWGRQSKAGRVVHLAVASESAERVWTAAQVDNVHVIGSGLSLQGYGANLPGLYKIVTD